MQRCGSFSRHRPSAAAGPACAAVQVVRRRRFECCFSGRLWAYFTPAVAHAATAGRVHFYCVEMLDNVRGGREVGRGSQLQKHKRVGWQGVWLGLVVSLVFASWWCAGISRLAPFCFLSAQLVFAACCQKCRCGVAAAAWTHTPYCTEKRVRVRALMPPAAAMRRREGGLVSVWRLGARSACPRGSVDYCTTDQRRPVNDCVSDLACGSIHCEFVPLCLLP